MAAVGDPRGYYKLLGVHRTASAEEIKAAFRERAKLYHPDGSGTAADQERFRLLREAYEALRDPQKRLHYDADGLAAERREEQARRAREQAGGRGERASAARPGPGPRPTGTRAAAAPEDGGLRVPVVASAVLGLALLLALGLLGLVWSRLDSRDQVIANLTYRLEGALAQVGENRPPVQAGDLVRIEGALAQAIGAADEGDFVFRTGLAFPQDTADLDETRRAQLAEAVRDLRREIEALPAGSKWVVLIEGYTGRAADARGVLIDAWELALLRVGTTTEYLVRHGISPERVAVRFHAGVAPSEQQQIEPQRVELKLLCCVG
jgi:outer membrane protein OmpA-like peptidoglycan-associated protein